jgi:hypothetical protein
VVDNRTPAPESVAASVYIGAIDGLVKDEHTRKASLEERAIRVISTAGALAALLFAIAKFGGGGILEAPDETLVVLSLVFFVMAAILGLFANEPQSHPVIKDEELRNRVDLATLADPDRLKAAHLVAEEKVEWLIAARVNNGKKAWYLFFALTFEVVAVICVAGAVAIVVDHNRTAVGLAIVASVSGVVALRVLFRAGPSLIYDRPGVTRITPPSP